VATSLVTEIFSYFGIKINPGEEMKLRDLSKVLGDMSMSSVAAAVGLGATGAAIAEMAEKTGAFATDLKNLSLYLDIPQKTIQQWDEYGESLGFAKDEINSMLIMLQQKRPEFLLKGGAQMFQQFLPGVNAYETDPTKFAVNIQKLFSAAGKVPGGVAMQNKIMEMFGFGQRQVEFMRKMSMDKDALDKISKKPFVTDEELSKWENLRTAWIDMTQKTIVLLEKITPIADVLTYITKHLFTGPQLWGETAKSGLLGPVPAMLERMMNPQSNNNTAHITVTVNGTGDNKKDGETVGDSVKNALRQTFGRGGGMF
jgi:hypothetical protein